jgi:hypothetical protein
VLATAYENGGLAGQLVLYALLAAMGFRLVRRLVRGSFGSGFRRSPAGTVLGLVVVGAVMIFSAAGSIGGDDMSRERANIVSGCKGSGQSASVCGCYADGLLEHTGHDRARFAAFEDKLKRDHDAGRPLPAHVLETAARCAAVGPDASTS